MDYERIHQTQGAGLSPRKLRSMLMGEDKKRKEEEAMRSSELDDPGSGSVDMCKDVDVVSELPQFPESIEQCRLKDSSESMDVFEFEKGERAVSQRVPLPPFSKPAPSKWDDAQKWISSPCNRQKTSPAQVAQGAPRRVSSYGCGGRHSSATFAEVLDRRLVPYEEPDTKRIDLSQGKKEDEGSRFISWDSGTAYSTSDAYGKSEFLIEKIVSQPAISLSQHDSSVSITTTTAFIPPPSTARSVSMRDMGTEMTPIASQEPSRVGTPVKSMSPSQSPTSSWQLPTLLDPRNEPLDLNDKDLSDKERTRRDIMVLGTQLGKMNIAAWASKEEEDKDASSSLKNVAVDHLPKNMANARADAWEEAEKAKYMTRFEQEELKIQAWENHQKAKIEAEMRRIEVEVERIRAKAQDKLMNKLAAARHRAEEKRVAAEAERDRQAAKTEQQAEYIRKTGRMPSKFSCCNWCKFSCCKWGL